MTEYEMADLAMSADFRLHSQVSLFQTAVAMMTDVIQQYMGILFGYILAAYFIGTSLGGRQVWILNTLYVLWQVWMIGVIASRGYLASLILEKIPDSAGTPSVLLTVPSVLTATSLTLLVAALSASLYFMWSVRHPKAG